MELLKFTMAFCGYKRFAKKGYYVMWGFLLNRLKKPNRNIENNVNSPDSVNVFLTETDGSNEPWEIVEIDWKESTERPRQELLKPVLEKLLNDVEKNKAQSKKGLPIIEIQFSLTKNNIVKLEIVSFERREPDQWFTVHVLHKETCFGYKQDLKSGSLEEIRSYLCSEKGLNEFCDTLYELSDSVDKHVMSLQDNKSEKEEDKSEKQGLPSFNRSYYISGKPVYFTSASGDVIRTIIDENGIINNFPGIEPGSLRMLGRSPGYGISYGASFNRYGDNMFIMRWTVQPDGRYWVDEDGYGMTDDEEIELFALIDINGCFTSPFRIYSRGNTNYYYGIEKREQRPLFAYEWKSVKNASDEWEMSIVRCCDISGEITIPDRIDGHKVTEIEILAFACCTGLRKVNLPDTIKYIGSSAFYGCFRLEHICMSKQMNNIDLETAMYKDCISLKSIEYSRDEQ